MSQDRGGARRALRSVALAASVVVVLIVPQMAVSEEAYVGSETCADCHDELAAGFAGTAHGRGTVKAWDGASACEACHGPGKTHAEGEATAIVGAASLEITEKCLSCHGGAGKGHWQASAHDESDVRCSDCHKVHQSWAIEGSRRNEEITDSCLSCHQDMRKHLFQRSGHPLRHGTMSCVSCHDPHGSTAEAAIAAVTPNDKCYECHAEKRGPFLYEHQPVREDCSTCHNPHGSNQTMLLQTAAPRLCQSCHQFGHHQTVPGQPTQVWNQNRSCVNCHYRIHGSNHPSGVVFLR